MTQVAPRLRLPFLRVKRNKVALAVSAVMCINIALMPMKAYLTEHFPWTLHERQTFGNFSQFNTTILKTYQQLYNYDHLPKEAPYFEDVKNNSDVMRQVVVMSTPIPSSDCTKSFLVGKPTVVFYGLAIREFLCEFAAANHSGSDASWENRGTCHYIKYFTASIGFQCVWITHGNTLGNTSKPNEYTITNVHTIAADPTWYWIKFCYRCGMSIIVCFLMWSCYYRHCFQLEYLLSTIGHRRDLPEKQKHQWHYELVWGDPTPIILMSPIVSLAFFLDCWFSAETISIVIPRASQTDDTIIMFSAFLYLSRTVWFAYAAMCLTAILLKKFHMEHTFIEIDPTIVAVFTTFFGPAMTFASCNLGFMLELYFFLFDSVVQREDLHEQNDGAMPSFAYSISIASAVIIYGFIGGTCRKPNEVMLPSSTFSSVWYNGIKTKAAFFAMRFVPPYHATDIPEYGGSIYRFNTVFHRYKKSPTVNFRSSDCFICCYQNGKEVERIRVTLLSSLDRNLNDVQHAIIDGSDFSPFCVQSLYLAKGTKSTPRLLLSEYPTAWCV